MKKQKMSAEALLEDLVNQRLFRKKSLRERLGNLKISYPGLRRELKQLKHFVKA